MTALSLQTVRLDRSIDRQSPCCQNIAIVHPRSEGVHAADLRCASCGKHRGFLRRASSPVPRRNDPPFWHASRSHHLARFKHRRPSDE